jgi:hypothetical protein
MFQRRRAAPPGTRSGSHGKKSVSVMIERMSPVGFVM